MDREPEGRLRSLCRSLDDLTREVSGLERTGAGPAGEDGGGCAVRFTSSAGAVATLVLSPGDASMTTRSAGDHPDAGSSETRDDLNLDLTRGYTWDQVRCDSADDLARLLVKHMFRRTGQAAPEPEANPGDMEDDREGGGPGG